MPEEAKTLYGPRKLGQEEFEKQEKKKVLSSRAATVYGSRKGGGEALPDYDGPLLETPVKELGDALADVDDLTEVKAAQAADDRSSAQSKYRTRIAELELAQEPAEGDEKDAEGQEGSGDDEEDEGDAQDGQEGDGEPQEPAEGDEKDATASDNPFLATGDDDGKHGVTIEELEAKLEEEPGLLDDAIEAEFQHGQPRKGAVELFKRLEEAGEGREKVLKLLDGHL